MKTVFENRMVAHVWAQQNQSEGRSANKQFFFKDKTIFSYRASWPLATFIGENEILLNVQRCSVTTGNHLSCVNCALKSDVKIWRVDRNIISNPTEFLKLTPEKREKFLTEKQAKEDEANKEVKRIRDAAARKQRKEKTAASNMTLAQLLTMWRGNEEMNYHEKNALQNKLREEYPGERQSDILRLKDDKTIETNRGATVPVKFAKKIYAQFKKCIIEKTEWVKNGKRIPAGNFEIDRIDQNGNVYAGCHYIAAREISDLAHILKLS
jgi:hypothetical protein